MRIREQPGIKMVKFFIGANIIIRSDEEHSFLFKTISLYFFGWKELFSDLFVWFTIILNVKHDVHHF